MREELPKIGPHVTANSGLLKNLNRIYLEYTK
jgi:hypothetical protein